MIFKSFAGFLLIAFFFMPQTALSKSPASKSKKTTLEELKVQAKTESAKAKEEEAKARIEKAKAGAEREAVRGSQKVNIQAKGIILTFKSWPPPEKDKTSILAKLKKAGLKKDTEIKRFKIWLYQWPKVNPEAKVEKLCKDLLAFSSVASCAPDHVVDTNSNYDDLLRNAERQVENANQGVENAEQSVNNAEQSLVTARQMVENAEQMLTDAEQHLQTARQTGNSSEIESAESWLEDRRQWLEGRKQWLASSESWLEGRKQWLEGRKQWLASSESWLEGVRARQEPELPEQPPDPYEPAPEPDEPPEPDDPESAVNLKSCNILSSNFGLNQYTSLSHRQGALSDYWAQEMIGADLLKEEVEKAPPVSKSFVELFDRGEHADAVKNLISGDGKYSVLPEMGDSISISQSSMVSDFLKHSDRLLRKVDDVCGLPPDTTSLDVVPDQGQGSQG